MATFNVILAGFGRRTSGVFLNLRDVRFVQEHLPTSMPDYPISNQNNRQNHKKSYVDQHFTNV